MANGLVIGLEGKRYEPRTALRLDQLKAKLIDAVHTHPGLDLWMLASTREVTATDQRELRDLGGKHGVAVEVLDWPDSPAVLPALGVLAATARDVVREHLGGGSAVSSWLDELEGNERFAAERDQLVTRLTSGDIGYAAAQRAVTQWLGRSLCDLATSKAKLDTFANLRDPSARHAPRAAIVNRLDVWFKRVDAPPLVLLGDEGVGKTWAILSWWDHRAGDDGDGLPLTVVIPARRVEAIDPGELVANALAQQTGLRDVKFWRRRLQLWSRNYRSGDGPQLLLVVDGLNQNWGFKDWAQLFQPLFAEERRGQFALAMTCRPDHWHTHLQSLASMIPRVEEVAVARFDDVELDSVLQLYGLARSEFSVELVELMRSPRLCHLAIRRRDEIQASGDITPERLIYEDWKHRLSVHGERLAIGDLEFRGLVAEMGRRLREALASPAVGDASLSRRELLEELSRDSGAGREDLATAISEIVDGGWLEPAGEPHRFRLKQQSASFALGLALVNELSTTPDSAATQQRLAEFLDPLRGQELGVDILRAACTTAVLDTQCRTPVRCCLLDAWLSSQNFRSSDFESFWRLIGVAPESFLDVAETAWLRCHGGSHLDQVLIRSLANAAQWSQVAECLRKRSVKWLGMYWGDRRAGAVLGYEPNTSGAEQRRQATAQRYQVWQQEVQPKRPADQITLRNEDDGVGASWLVHRAVGVMSFLPRLPFVPALTAWGVSRSIMGSPRHFDEVAWLLRLNSYDPEETQAAVLGEAEQLLALQHPLATEAAYFLLEALASPSAMAQVERPPRPPWKWLDTIEADRVSGVIHWDHQKALKWGRCREAPLDATLGLGEYAVDPNLELSKSDIDVLRGIVPVSRSDEFSTCMGQTALDLSLDTAREVLARWAPDALGGLLRRIFATAPSRESDALRMLAHEVPDHLLVLNGSVLEELARAASNTSDPGVRRDVLLAQLAQRPAAEQIDVLADLPEGCGLDTRLRHVLEAPDSTDYATLAERLRRDHPEEQLLHWLAYLSLVQLDHMPPGFEPLAPLVKHPHAHMRRLALEVIHRSGDASLALEVAGEDWRIASDMTAEEAAFGSLVLCEAAAEDPTTVPDVRERISPQALSALVRRRGNAEDVEAFSEYVRQALLEAPAVQPLGPCRIHQAEALEVLVQQRGEEVVGWVDSVLGSEKRWSRMDRERFPHHELCQVLLRHYPEVGARFWRLLLDAHDRAHVRSNTFEVLAIEGPDHSAVDGIRETILDRAGTDADLRGIAELVVAHGREAWLLGRIQRDLVTTGCAATTARGLTMAGLLDASPAAEELWKHHIVNPPAPGWLAEVNTRARRCFEMNRHARHWLEEFIVERDRDRAFGAYVLFLASADRRALAWGPHMIGEVFGELPVTWRDYWLLNWDRLVRSIEKRDNGAKDTLFGTKIMKHTHAPWL